MLNPISATVALHLVIGAYGFQIQSPPQRTILSNIVDKCATGILCAGIAVLVGTQQPANAATDTVEGSLANAIVQISDTSYPVFASLSDEGVTSFSNKVERLVTKKIPAAKASAAIERGIDAFMGIPNDKLEKWTATLKQSYDGVSSDSCNSIPIPVETIGRLADSEAFKMVPATKFKALEEKYAPSNQAIPKTKTAVCLPANEQGLEKLWIGQTELTMNLPKKETQEFVRAASKAVLSVQNSELLRLVPEAKKTFTSSKEVDPKMALRFQKAGKALDKAIQADPRFTKLVPTS